MVSGGHNAKIVTTHLFTSPKYTIIQAAACLRASINHPMDIDFIELFRRAEFARSLPTKLYK